ncbi:MAG: leucine-rich repeat domain-containing protein, partial [Holosporales bacterium]|nr:leucine-rich repeat domain-containing protein [Holosporales bacterium]
TSLTIDEFSLTPGTYDSTNGYNPPIWGDLLANIRDIGTATGSNLHTLRLDSLVGVGYYELGNPGTASPATYTVVEVFLPKLTTAGCALLSGCIFLASVYLPLLASVEAYSLVGCTALKEILFPSLTTAQSGLLSGCTSLTVVSIGTGLDPLAHTLTVGDYFLYDCLALTTLIIGIPIGSWGTSHMFGGTTVPRNITLYLCDAEHNRDNTDTDVANNKWRGIIFGSIIKGAPPQ